MTVANDERMIEEVTRVGDLFDFYAPLLTERQKRMIELHFLEDWSLSEIADQYGISRQAVHDNLRRAKEQMEWYETTLHLVSIHIGHLGRMERLFRVWNEVRDVVPPEERDRMDEVVDEWVNEEGLLTGRGTHA